MRWITAYDDDHGAVDPGAWESVEITPVAPVTATGRPWAALAAGLLVLGVVVGAGLWPVASARPAAGTGSEQCPAATNATSAAGGVGPSSVPASKPDVPLATSVIETRPPIVLLMPGPGEVILGPWIALAGRVNGTRRGPAVASASWVHVVIVLSDAMVGEADLRVVGQGFAGSIPIVEQARGNVAEIRISDGRNPDHTLVDQKVVLGPGR
jgi:hypothetical protein